MAVVFCGRFCKPRFENIISETSLHDSDIELLNAWSNANGGKVHIQTVFNNKTGKTYCCINTYRQNAPSLNQHPAQDEHNQAKANGYQPQPEHRYEKEDEPNDNDIPF